MILRDAFRQCLVGAAAVFCILKVALGGGVS